MKIILISDLYPLKKDRSIPLVLEDFALAFKNFGVEISVIRPNFILNSLIRNHKIFKSGKYFEKGIEIYNKNFFFPFNLISKKTIEEIEKFSVGADVLISHMPSGHIFSNLIMEKSEKISKIPHISILHQSDLTVLKSLKYKFYFKNVLLNSLKKSCSLGARNPFLAKDAFEYSLKTDFILPSFVEKENILETKNFEQNKKLKIITLSKLIKRKNIHLVIEALKEIEKKQEFDFEYNIFGEGNKKEKSRLLKLIKKNNLENFIKINDFIPHEKINSVLDKNDVFILPSENETFGLAYLEALSRGLIVVGVKNTGVSGILKNKENGFLIDPNKKNVLEVLKEINDLKVEEKAQISKRAIETIKNFEKEKIMTKYFENIKKIL